jgi:hypothetical protein
VHGIESKKRLAGIGEVLEGNELRNSGLKLHFGSTNIISFNVFRCPHLAFWQNELFSMRMSSQDFVKN